MLSLTAVFAVAVLCTAWLIYNRKHIDEGGSPRPLPGPKPVPFIGNIFDLPTTQLWKTISQWSSVYGNIISVNIFGVKYIFLNSSEDAKELLDRRSAIYSDRPEVPLTMVREIIGWKDSLPFQPYGNAWRQNRKIFHHFFHINALAPYQPIQLEVFRKMLLGLIERPEDFMHITRHALSTVSFRIGYGIEDPDAFISMAEEAAEQINQGGDPGTFLVNVFPFREPQGAVAFAVLIFLSQVKFVPWWFPGAGWKRLGKAWKMELQELTTAPFEAAKSLIESNKSHYSVVREMLYSDDLKLEAAGKESVTKWIATTIYIVAADSTISVLHNFILAMILYPDVQSKAQAELDSVVGGERLPDHSDKPNLPYLEAVLTEVLRWRTVGPLGLAHATSKADNYKGYFIPKGTVIVPNVWHMTRDESVYPDPDTFRPERWLDEDGQLDCSASILDSILFGFGRRVCPGRHLAMDSLFIAAASILATLRLEQLTDVNGQPIPVRQEYNTYGITVSLKPFECKISPRNGGVVKRIRNSLGE